MSDTSRSDNDLQRGSSILDAVEHLETVAFVPAKQRHTNVGQLAGTIASDAYENGISQSALGRLVKLLTKKTQLDQTTCSTLIKNLYPRERVPSQVVTDVVCSLGPSKNKPSAATQALLLRWLILIYEILEDASHLSKLYAVLFNSLDMISLRKPLCHLLALITRRKHVKPFRIQALMELRRNSSGDERELLGLLRVFKNHYPDIIVGDVGLSRRAGLFFKHPDLQWTHHMKLLQEKSAESLAGISGLTFQIVRRGIAKRSKAEGVVPDVQTSRVSHGHTSLEELRNVTDFVERLEKIEPPNQLVSSLGDNLAQKYLFLVQPGISKRRLEDWMESFLDQNLEQIQEGEVEDSAALTVVLTLTVDYVRHLKEIPPAVIDFLKQYLSCWSGRENRVQILEILEYLPIESFESLEKTILNRLESLALQADLASKAAVLDFYTALIRQWGVRIRMGPSTAAGESRPLSDLIAHAELLASSLLETLPGSESNDGPSDPIILAVVHFYSTLAALFSHAHSNSKIRITIPLAPSVYTLAFQPDLSTLSLLCSILASYKSSFEASLSSQVLQSPNSTEPLYSAESVGRFNGYVMDICNLVWRNRALNAVDPNALGCLVPQSTVSALTQYIRELNEANRERRREDAFAYNVSSIFSLSHHIALCNTSAACFAELEEERQIEDAQVRLRRPVTQKALSALEKDGGIQFSWQDYRLRMLDWLDGVGSRGIGDLMRSTMKALRKDS